MLSEPAVWGPLLIAAVVPWVGSWILKVMHTAEAERREDHREMMRVLEDISRDISNLEANLDGLARRYDPPDLSDYQ